MERGEHNPRRRRRNRGFTLLQCLMAVTMLATLSVTMMDLLGRSSEMTHLSWEVDVATALAEAQLELARAVHEGGLQEGEELALLIGGEVLDQLPFGEGSVDVIPEDEGLRRVRARVSWGQKMRRRSVVLETFIAVPREEE
jgi:type II secretory pathway pseudopilin PulG